MNAVPSLITGLERAHSPIFRDLDQRLREDSLPVVPVAKPGIADTDSELLPRKTVDILIADPHPVVLAGMSAMLATYSDVRIVGKAHDGREAVDRYLATLPDVGILEVRLPLLSGIEAVSAILREVPHARLVMFTTCQCTEDVYRAVRAEPWGMSLRALPEKSSSRAYPPLQRDNSGFRLRWARSWLAALSTEN